MQVIATAGLLLAAVYTVLWAPFEPADPLGPATLLSTGHLGRLVMLAVLTWVLAAVAGMTTTLSRPEGALIAALLAAGGLSMRSASIEPLLWDAGRSAGTLYVWMAVQMLLFAVVLLGAEAATSAVRGLLRCIAPGLLWQDPLAELSEQDRKDLTEADTPFEAPDVSLGLTPTSAVLAGTLRRVLGKPSQNDTPLPTAGEWKQAGLCCGTGVLAAIVLTVILMASHDRGQVLFAVFASFAIGGMLAHHLFPTRLAIAAWAMPIVTAVLFYGLAVASASRGGALRPQFQILPIDWLTLGCGGALLGVWFSERMRETRIIETLEKASHARHGH
ncbi:MAG: hypothetical protein GVY16_05590 [Planctomycetes bacterium]|nr:hypothetical protein [Planctomycetota bacterium]